MQEKLQKVLAEIIDEINKVVIGMDDLKQLLVAAAISGGHILIEGPPGTAKTTLAHTFAVALGGIFKRIQFTPDMLPSDITGFYMYTLNGDSRFIEGPVFCNVLLLDELNRTTPRTQSALLEVMQEGKVTIEGKDHIIPQPFIAIATQIKHGAEGTFPLTSVQADRFMFNAESHYPSQEAEKEILQRIDFLEKPAVSRVADPATLLDIRKEVNTIHVSEQIENYIISLVNTIRYNDDMAGGVGPRATISLYKGARALAFMDKRDYVIPDDVKRLAIPALKHRMQLRPEAEMNGSTPEELINKTLSEVAVPK